MTNAKYRYFFSLCPDTTVNLRSLHSFCFVSTSPSVPTCFGDNSPWVQFISECVWKGTLYVSRFVCCSYESTLAVPNTGENHRKFWIRLGKSLLIITSEKYRFLRVRFGQSESSIFVFTSRISRQSRQECKNVPFATRNFHEMFSAPRAAFQIAGGYSRDRTAHIIIPSFQKPDIPVIAGLTSWFRTAEQRWTSKEEDHGYSRWRNAGIDPPCVPSSLKWTKFPAAESIDTKEWYWPAIHVQCSRALRVPPSILPSPPPPTPHPPPPPGLRLTTFAVILKLFLTGNYWLFCGI